MTQITNEILTLFKRFRSSVGAPVMEAEITNDQLCDMLDIAIEDYTEKVQNWVIENNWVTLYGKNLQPI